MQKTQVSEETSKILEEMEKFSRKVTASSRKSREFLVKTGICTPRGNLKQVYR
ncbi:hypothetical protein EDC39_107146 [Geothermobacter ehrlichii]|uniref:Uncharacterized protein n=1 Tax=Geothermobacter ehrlichii TaxID=213224 RepID=A0A5D3WJA1_9BACT|nr:hypothetical protein [Geothermobacter ehrlichii]TYO98345.1 hypothetical protein EDC39_107146 [Geothermobacter ehrlichii]